MTKIEAFENKLIQDGMSDADFEEYKVHLKRVHDDFLKLQHCYMTAGSFPKERMDQAIRLIDYGIDNFI